MIVGKNNQGKTNVFSALDLAFNTLKSFSHKTLEIRADYNPKNISNYNYKKDYPVSLETEKNQSPTKIILEFNLSDEMNEAFYKILI